MSAKEPSFRQLLEPNAGGEGLTRLVRYAELLERWSRSHNLVKFRSRSELVERHIVDALAAADFLDDHGTLLDVGSGAGLPGIPLLAVKPGWHGDLLEPRQKRWTFLRLVIRELGLDASAHRVRYQDFGERRSAADVMTVRALGGYETFLGWARPRLSESGRVLVWTTVPEVGGFQKLDGWRVLSSALPGLTHGRLVQLQPCFT